MDIGTRRGRIVQRTPNQVAVAFFPANAPKERGIESLGVARMVVPNLVKSGHMSLLFFQLA
jgi:hypothetical protein